MSKKHKRKSNKKDDTSDSKTSSDKRSSFSKRSKKKYEEAEIRTRDTTQQPQRQRSGYTERKWSLNLKDTTKGFQNKTLKDTKHTSGILISAEGREKITMHFKKKVNFTEQRCNVDFAAMFPSKEDCDTHVCSEPDVKRRKKELLDLRVLNSREKNKKATKVDFATLKIKMGESVLEDLKKTSHLTECSSLCKKNPSKLYDSCRKHNILKKPSSSCSAFDDFSGPPLQTQACRGDRLEKVKHTSSDLPCKRDNKIQCAPLCSSTERLKWRKDHKHEEQRCSGSTKNISNLQTQRKKLEPVAFHVVQINEIPCCSSASEAIASTDTDQEMQIAEDLHIARIDKKMALPVVQTCGELTNMEIDLPDDETNMSTKTLSGLNTLIVIDTNIMISHLEFIKSLKNTDIPGIGRFVLVIPWVVLQELDNLKRGTMLANVGQKAIPAVHFIYMCLKNQDPKLWGQSMQLASQQTHGFIVENNDDRVLQCCLQYRNLFAQAEVVLLTDDKNLCNKALVSEVKAFSKADFVTALQKLAVNNAVLSQDTSSVQPQSEKDTRSKEAKEISADPLSTIMLDLEKSLGEVLSFVLQQEMIIAYGDLWTEVVYHKPPWTLRNLLECYKKHWMAVFGQIISRTFLSTIEYLYAELCKAKAINPSTMKNVLQESKMLLESFSSRSNYAGVLSRALAQVNKLLETFEETQSRSRQDSPKSTSSSAACEKMEDAGLPQQIRNTEDNSLLPESLAQGNRHLEIWSVFESVWNAINLFSVSVFQKLDLNTINSTQNMSSFKEAFLDLQKLMAAVNEILAGIRQTLTPNSSFQDVWVLYSFLTKNEINNSVKFTAEELYDCVSQEMYKKRLSIGCGQLAKLEHTVKQCYESVCLETKNRGWL